MLAKLQKIKMAENTTYQEKLNGMEIDNLA